MVVTVPSASRTLALSAAKRPAAYSSCQVFFLRLFRCSVVFLLFRVVLVFLGQALGEFVITDLSSGASWPFSSSAAGLSCLSGFLPPLDWV